MKKFTLNENQEWEEINILDIGNKITFSGLIMSDGVTDFLCYLPDENRSDNLVELEMNTQDWEKFFLQTDQLETEVLAQAKDGKLTKILLRKSQRQVEAGISWKVFARDGYKCRYCGISGVPMTVDHLVCWEKGGPSIEANLVTSCRKCNKLRGNIEYADWLKHPSYVERSKNLTRTNLYDNLSLVESLKEIPIKYFIQKR